MASMMMSMGARNTRGFSSSIDSGLLPPQSHITYQGIFNQLKFDVGPKTNKLVDCHFGYARYQFQQSIADKNINDYLAIFLKSERDGAQRNDVPLNAVLCLDISGSMSGNLKHNKNYDQAGKKSLSRLDLSVQAIKMFISKLRSNDAFGIVTFQNQAKVIVDIGFKKDMPKNVFELLDEIKTNGGTTISCGFQKSKYLLQNFIKTNEFKIVENRIIMLTDVDDNSLSGQLNFLQQASDSGNIHTTIIGISDSFKSEVCQKLKNIKGFNYFCAINQDDIKKHVFQQFDFHYLPSAHNVQINLINDDIVSFQTFGTSDSDLVNEYNNCFQQNTEQTVVTKIKTVFPSEIQIQNGKVFTVGGIMLIKLKRKTKNPFFKGQIKLCYQNLELQKHEQLFDIQFNFPVQQQFFSQECLREGLEGFAFASQVKSILKKRDQLKDQKKCEQFSKALKNVQKIVPECKKKDLQNLLKLVQSKQIYFAKKNQQKQKAKLQNKVDQLN